jgi:hypothetical protein
VEETSANIGAMNQALHSIMEQLAEMRATRTSPEVDQPGPRGRRVEPTGSVLGEPPMHGDFHRHADF